MQVCVEQTPSCPAGGGGGSSPGTNREAVPLLAGNRRPVSVAGQAGPQTQSLGPAGLPVAANRQPPPGQPLLGALPMGGGARGPEDTLHLGSSGAPHPCPEPQVPPCQEL